ncbi:asparaginase [Nocardiopsis sp. ATB16-24]|uniref:asparaginase n=1 Tax=Nocardiopsis sp. ATB16-24 TaxID=3019555 RepID=UPI002557715F|nr:asparaginase [Nocardiopsis sp. ATB16-24]
MPDLVLLSTGGTIATTSTEAGRVVGVDAKTLLRSAEGHWDSGAVRVRALDVKRLVSFAATTEDVLDLARAVRAASAEADGIVVTHGTDSMEEAAFLVSLTHEGEVPVVFTGAQRPFDDTAPDGPRNLASALRWAASSEARGTGVSVVFDDKVLPVVGVRKVHTLALSAFAAPGRGPIATVDEAGVRLHARPSVAPALLSLDVERLPRVDVIGQYLGADAVALEAALACGARGLVVAGFGAGNTAPDVTEACLALLDEGFPVAVASRVGSGAVLGLYSGGGADLLRAGAIPAGDLSPWQTRLLLAAALTRTAGQDGPGTVETCRRWLEQVGAVAR